MRSSIGTSVRSPCRPATSAISSSDVHSNYNGGPETNQTEDRPSNKCPQGTSTTDPHHPWPSLPLLPHGDAIDRQTTLGGQTPPSPPDTDQHNLPRSKKQRESESRSRQLSPFVSCPSSDSSPLPRPPISSRKATRTTLPIGGPGQPLKIDYLQYMASGSSSYVFSGYTEPLMVDGTHFFHGGVSLVVKVGTDRALFEREARAHADIDQHPTMRLAWRHFFPKIVGLYSGNVPLVKSDAEAAAIDGNQGVERSRSIELYVLVMEHCGWPAASGDNWHALTPRDR